MAADLPTFDLSSCRDMLDKLHWELEQLEQPHDRRDAAYHCFNAAVTAWHMHEWVWRDIKCDPKLRAKLARRADVRPSKFDKKEWVKYILSKETGCPELRLCRRIATASKHGGFKVWHDDPGEFTIHASAPSIDPENATLGEIFRAAWRWKAVIDGQVIQATDIFEQAFQFWDGFIRVHGIAKTKIDLGSLDV